MRKLKLPALIVFFLFVSQCLFAQDPDKGTGIGAFMRSDQRSYVVIAVMLTILVGLILYVVRLDRKISKMEKEN